MLKHEMKKKQGVVMNLNMIASKRKIVGEICKHVGMTHSTDNKAVITKKQMENACEYVKENSKEITSIYKSRRNEKNSDGIKPWKMLLNKILMGWSGSTISPNEVKRKIPVNYRLRSDYDDYNSIISNSNQAIRDQFVRMAMNDEGGNDENEIIQVNSDHFDCKDSDGNII
jgi:hypothetical protein